MTINIIYYPKRKNITILASLSGKNSNSVGQKLCKYIEKPHSTCVERGFIVTPTEYDTRHSSLFNIWKDKVEIINWNIPFNFGLITLDNLRPHAKNPAIANFFSQLDYVEEIGKGTRTMFEYVPRISRGQEPIIEEKDEFKVTIPYLMAGPAAETTEKTTGKTTGKTTEKILQLIKKKSNHYYG